MTFTYFVGLTPWPCFGVELLFAGDNWTSRVDNNLQHRGWTNLFISCNYLSKFSFGPHTHTLSKKMQKTNKRCVKLCTTGTWWWSRVRSACSLSVVNFRKVLVTNVLTKLVQIVYRLEICLRYNSTVTIYIGRKFWYNDWTLAMKALTIHQVSILLFRRIFISSHISTCTEPMPKHVFGLF